MNDGSNVDPIEKVDLIVRQTRRARPINVHSSTSITGIFSKAKLLTPYGKDHRWRDSEDYARQAQLLEVQPQPRPAPAASRSQCDAG